MAFENISEKIQAIFKNLRGKGKLTEKDVQAAMREVRLALLEADVSYKVVKEFINKVTERAVGSEVLESLTPAQQVIKIVHEELTQLMGGTQSKISLAAKPPTVVMMVGLQGSGKTTSSAKLARHMKKQGKSPLLAACDVYRPAAIKQLQVLGEQLDIPVFSLGDKQSPVDIARGARAHAEKNGFDLVILDTAGRLHIDEELMEELAQIKQQCHPQEILLVVDAMTGQDAVNVAEKFNQTLGLDGVILTKLDGDTRGGAALSVKAVTGQPIKFTGMGEKLDALEPFYPDRMASRILGMGDVLTLIEKAQATVDLKKAQELERKLRQNEFTFDDYLDQLQQLQKMGPLNQLIEMIPGLGKLKGMQGVEINEKDIKHVEAIIRSMTREERRKPDIINGSRRKRIAMGSGTSIQEVNRTIKQFEQMQKMMKQFAQLQQGGKLGKKGMARLPFFQ
ncbi:MAG TPA: signal recognition particle protein [Peptococcaceae bacterium]|nr:signal recognition particle protein [Clostridia bacterium]HOB81235.1 signal recognition particle protein [Peptococcaceae bacterium]HPZ70731.1 signal recognition particle protein [Peptococcaceae bacterium]HQD53321.1 signal recognition particle protein [Peptococcaceae bacterium]